MCMCMCMVYVYGVCVWYVRVCVSMSVPTLCVSEKPEPIKRCHGS